MHTIMNWVSKRFRALILCMSIKRKAEPSSVLKDILVTYTFHIRKPFKLGIYVLVFDLCSKSKFNHDLVPLFLTSALPA